MSVQLTLPAKGQEIVRASSERLEALRADVVGTKFQLRENAGALEQASRHPASRSGRRDGMLCNDLLADLTFRVELHLENKIETETQH